MLVKWDGLREFWSKGEDRIGHYQISERLEFQEWPLLGPRVGDMQVAGCN